ncbi:hypothetical protein AMTRI_Chr09g20520 [Amborella trichopoda]|uniref:BURP domain-containing protein n=1 Tax=Amborella trichopoda TaxID=13333 RepID=W1PZG3_AMBTC|nr:BURP domain-containing protein 17 [Amborella trichopoda]ERN13554.1 hypothetical protein AMTR_s00041p00235540 [Amborella trichopoda]|eukprot:XP_006852087.1 BURP domain-containing protein 17 [Amborella trichopoda]
MGLGNQDPRFLNNELTKEHCDPKETTLFLEEELKVGMNKNFHFRKYNFNNASPSLPRENADSIAFLSVELPRIVPRFAFPPASCEANEVHETLVWCESLKAEEKCLTSLEAMIDYVTPSSLDHHNITMLHTSIH